MKTRGMNFVEGLQLAFIVLRLCNVIDWSWLWVLTPLWVPLVYSIMLELAKIIIKGGTAKDGGNDEK